MSEFRKTYPHEIYFITLTVVGWIDVFTRKRYAEIVIENLIYCQQKEGLKIFAYVLMSNHLHLIVNRESEKNLTELLGRFKSFTAKEILKSIASTSEESRKEWLLYLFAFFAKKNKQYHKYHFWQYTNYPVLLDSTAIIEQKINYIHENPVKAGKVTDESYYVYSSANPDGPILIDEL
ncbi:MAG: transposase [Bacteroidetes bacterium]|nr:transposase [Bacteroidota bacterium]